MTSFRGAQFKQLQREWYEKLEAAGFEDIETNQEQIKPSVHPHTRNRALRTHTATTLYYYAATEFLNAHNFQCRRCYRIWLGHSCGDSVRRIAINLSISRNQVWYRLRALIQMFKVKHMDQIKIRAVKETDREFIFASWLKNYKGTSEFAKRIKNDIYFNWHHKIIENIIRRPTTQIMVATLPEEEDVILGYIVYEPAIPVIHYCLVKNEWQKLGIAKALLKFAKIESPVFFTHWTNPMNSLIHKRTIRLIYDPYRI